MAIPPVTPSDPAMKARAEMLVRELRAQAVRDGSSLLAHAARELESVAARLASAEAYLASVRRDRDGMREALRRAGGGASAAG